MESFSNQSNSSQSLPLPLPLPLPPTPLAQQPPLPFLSSDTISVSQQQQSSASSIVSHQVNNTISSLFHSFATPVPPQTSTFSSALTPSQTNHLSYHFSQLSRYQPSHKPVVAPKNTAPAKDANNGKGFGPAANTRLQSRKLLEQQKLKREEERWQPFEEESLMDQNSLPNDLLELCLVRLPWRCLVRLRLVCKRWRALLLSPSFLQLRALSGYHEPWLFIFKPESRDSEAAILAYDPVYKKSQFIRAPILAGRNHYSLVVGGGLIYLVGGCCSSSSALVYNPVTNTWKEMPPMHHARDMPAVGVIEEKGEKGTKRTKLIVAGGKGLSRRSLCSAEIYDPQTNRWSYIMSLPSSFREVRFGTVHNGKLLVYSRRLNLINEVASYDVEKGMWSRLPMTHNSTAPPRYHHFHLVSCGGKLFKVEDGPHMKEETSISVWRLEESKMEWVEVAPIPPLEKGTWLWYIGCVAGKDNQCMIYLYEVNYPNLMSIRCCVCDLKTARAQWQWVTDMPYMVHPNDLTAIVQL
ncbi:hypothetical protein MPTK1_8g04650 [Marchantia polymorpha subsp. ruderalis]|uniref:F-box domain-containing protein n=1 Tax=Marchantia polymorpha TaxID=3197 RepID=A0A2R6VXV1_MARPO|nr:hypothetical protein MARPO_1710s0002 [Marchantia polymorpha]BBN18694.1 hypothetical protein Mp_8g04650 [Marchantia polymorpha subsp. ruderalis]|eukprot:PTQ26437.1 hypothetical protein MARPO_1710s0002 [Marchantia polymorpha]